MTERTTAEEIDCNVNWCKEQLDAQWKPNTKKIMLNLGKLSKEVYDGVVVELRKEWSILPFRLKFDKVTIYFYGRQDNKKKTVAPEQSGEEENA